MMRKLRVQNKKKRILDSFLAGQKDLWQLAEDFGTQPSYVASVLQTHGLIQGYHDLYNSAAIPMNIYAEEFKGKLGFKNQDVAAQSIERIDRTYRKLADVKDRAGQHHCMMTALTLFNRARFSGKQPEAEIFRVWLIRRLLEHEPKIEFVESAH